ncbi:MAG: thioredoxin family protein [Pirellulales bacterium]
MPSNRVLTLALFLFMAPPLVVATLHEQRKAEALRALPANQLPGNVVMYYSTQCGGCTSMLPLVKELQGEGYPMRLVDIHHDPGESQALGIRSVPTFIYYENGKEQYRVQSMMNRSILEDFCRGINRMRRLYN